MALTLDDADHTLASSEEERKRKGERKVVKSDVRESRRKYVRRTITEKVVGSALMVNVELKG